MDSSGREHQNFNVGLKAFIEKDKKLLILQDNEGEWELPGGRVEKSEINKSLNEILSRETGEELGKDFKLTIDRIFNAWIRRPGDADFCIFLVGFECKYVSGEITLSSEHRDFRWIGKEEIGELKFENTYQEAVEYYFAERAT